MLRFRRNGTGFYLMTQTEAPAPAEAVLGAATRLVLAADPAGVAEPVERVEHGRIVDLALVGLAARRHGGDLHVADMGEELREPRQQVAADDLQVVGVDLEAQVGPADLVDRSEER